MPNEYNLPDSSYQQPRGAADAEAEHLIMSRVRLRLIFPGILGAVVLAALILSRPAAAPEAGVFISHSDVNHSPDTLSVQFSSRMPEDRWDDILAAYGATLEKEMLVDGFAVVSVPEDRRAQIGQELAASGVVRTVEEVGYRYLASVVPQDPGWIDQWNMRLITVDDAWEVSQGAGVKVGVIDSGVAYENFGQFGLAPDLAGTKFESPYDFFDDDAHPNDDVGHGTHVTGTIAQTTSNEYGVAGIAYKATIIPVRACGIDSGSGTPVCKIDAIADGIIWAVDHGARIINLSLSSPLATSQVEEAAIAYAKNAGVVIIAAAGNGGNDQKGDNVLDYPAALPDVISVAASGFFGTRAFYSNYGLGEGGVNLDVIAPGGNPPIEKDGVIINPGPLNEGEGSKITQETYAHSCTNSPLDYTVMALCGYYGTSMATAHVTGVAALIRSAFPNLNRTQVRNLIRCSAEYVGTSGEDPDFQTGYGLVQAHAAVRDTDGDKLPDCIDSTPFTPTPTLAPTSTPTVLPTPFPPPNECLATPTPTPTPSPTPILTPTGTGGDTLPTPTSSPTANGTPTDTPSPSNAGIAGPATDTPTPTAPPTDTPSPTATESPPVTDTPTPTGTLTPTPTATVTPTATGSPTATGTPGPSPTPHIMCGDVNCDGSVNAYDALGIMRWRVFVPGTASCIGKGYVNCDGKLDQLDALVILRYVAEVPLGIPQSCHGIG
jgi:serine protease